MKTKQSNNILGISGKHAPRIVLAVNTEGSIIDCNLVAEKFLGNRDNLLDQSVTNFISLPEYIEGEKLSEYYDRKYEYLSKQFRSFAKFKNGSSKIVDIYLVKITEEHEPYFIAYLESRVGIQVLSDTALHQVADLVVNPESHGYFGNLVRNVALTLSVDCAIIGSVNDDRSCVSTLSAFLDGKHIDNFTYDLDNTPCKYVIEGSFHCFETETQKMFPNDKMFTELNIDGYAGIPLLNSDQTSSGILLVANRKSLENPSVVESVLKIFSIRAASELERIKFTEEKEYAEQKVQDTEERYKIIFNSAVNGFILWNSKSEIIDTNPAIWEAHGCTKEQYNKIGFFKFIHPDSRNLGEFIRSCINHGKKFRTELKQTRIDGSEFSCEVQGVPVVFHNEPHYLTLSVDLTEQKKAEESRVNLETQLRQAQKMESIGQLSGGIAHDFNNILTSIAGNLDLAINRNEVLKDEKSFKYLNRAKRSSVRARDLVQQLLTFSRGQKGEKSKLLLTPLMEECITLLKSILPSSLILNTSFSNEELTTFGNPVQFEQVLMNLCINAKDAMDDHGNLSITIYSDNYKDFICSSCKQKLDSKYAVIAISDTGCGISKNVQERMFEPFFSTKAVGKGTGMGLSTVHGIVHESNGHILVESTVNKGTTFKILLPLINTQQAEVNSETLQSEILNTNKASSLSGRVLVVDDEEDVCNFLNDLLENLGLEVVTKSNPLDARDLILDDNNHFDLVITDQTMPNLEGIKLAKEIRQEQPNIPIILHTGYADELLEKQVSELGIDRLIKKPADINVLSELVIDCLAT